MKLRFERESGNVAIDKEEHKKRGEVVGLIVENQNRIKIDKNQNKTIWKTM